MSYSEFGRFMTAAGGDEAIFRGLVGAVGDKQGQAACEAVSAFAQARGFDVSPADAAAGRQALLLASGNRDLADGELDGVEGGIDPAAVIDGVVGQVGKILDPGPWKNAAERTAQFVRDLLRQW